MARSNTQRRHKPGSSAWQAYLYILPALLIYAVFVLWPIADTLRYSLYRWDGFSTAVFIGFDNYREMLGDQVLQQSLFNNLAFILYYSILPILVGLLLAVLLTRRRIAGMSFFRAGLFVPYVLSMVVVGVVWRWIYNPAFGPLNQALKAVGLGVLARPWLGDFAFALPAVGIVATWVQYAFCMALFIAGIQSIDEALYDAAKIDGADGWRQFWHVTLPGLRNEISVALVTTLIAALRVFDLVYVTTRGGPGNQTSVGSLWLYQNAFQINRVGYAAAIAVVLTVLILAIAYGVIAVRTRLTEE
jgi:raffinose/stachyose/melibiose transport system permease protein